MYGLFSKYRSLWDMFYYFLLLFFLKHQWIHFHPGSTPGLGTEAEKVEKLSPLFFSVSRNSLVC